jgi:hypothetical protein
MTISTADLAAARADGYLAYNEGRIVIKSNSREAYLLAYGYAQGVMDASPSSVSLGVTTLAECADFATRYESVVRDHPFRVPPVASAFGEWRFEGSVSPTD